MKYSTVSVRMEADEKELLEQESFISGLSISDIIRLALKQQLNKAESFETMLEKRKREWII